MSSAEQSSGDAPRRGTRGGIGHDEWQGRTNRGHNRQSGARPFRGDGRGGGSHRTTSTATKGGATGGPEQEERGREANDDGGGCGMHGRMIRDFRILESSQTRHPPGGGRDAGGAPVSSILCCFLCCSLRSFLSCGGHGMGTGPGVRAGEYYCIIARHE